MQRTVTLLLFVVNFSALAQSNVEKYFEALEKFDLKTAYSYVHESEQLVKTFEEYEKDNPIEIFKGFRMINDKFYRFEVLVNDYQYSVRTVAMQENNSEMFRGMNMQIQGDASSEGAVYSPEYVKDWVNKKVDDTEKLFQEITVSVEVVDGKPVLGWKEEADRNAAYEESQRSMKNEGVAMKYVMMGGLNGGYKLKEAIEGLRSLKDKIPNSDAITRMLPIYEKQYNAIQKIKISIDLAKQNERIPRFVADLENNSNEKLTSLTIWYEFKDESGNILLKISNDLPQPYTDYSINPIPPGYKGEFKFGSPSADDFVLIKKSSSVTIEIKSLSFDE